MIVPALQRGSAVTLCVTNPRWLGAERDPRQPLSGFAALSANLHA